jgi:hypothetical protein
LVEGGVHRPRVNATGFGFRPKRLSLSDRSIRPTSRSAPPARRVRRPQPRGLRDARTTPRPTSPRAVAVSTDPGHICVPRSRADSSRSTGDRSFGSIEAQRPVHPLRCESGGSSPPCSSTGRAGSAIRRGRNGEANRDEHVVQSPARRPSRFAPVPSSPTRDLRGWVPRHPSRRSRLLLARRLSKPGTFHWRRGVEPEPSAPRRPATLTGSPVLEVQSTKRLRRPPR